MTTKRNRYKEMERYMTYALIGDAAVFALYLLFAGLGVVWLKVILAIIAIGTAGLGLAYLYLTQELLRKRSFWMSVGFASVAICLLFSLLLNFPSPRKTPATDPSTPNDTTAAVWVDTQYSL